MWIHGGGFQFGDSVEFPGDHLAQAGNVVFVSVQYRLGLLGFLASPAFGPHAGDDGLEDQQAGLQWVKTNIAAFGGDPRDVTIFGESAGGSSVCDQPASPTAAGLFERAISESGFYNSATGKETSFQPQDWKLHPGHREPGRRRGTGIRAECRVHEYGSARELPAQPPCEHAVGRQRRADGPHQLADCQRHDAHHQPPDGVCHRPVQPRTNDHGNATRREPDRQPDHGGRLRADGSLSVWGVRTAGPGDLSAEPLRLAIHRLQDDRCGFGHRVPVAAGRDEHLEVDTGLGL